MNLNKALAIAAVGAVAVASPALARDNVTVKGSSTVLPYAKIVQAEFAVRYDGQIATPVVSGGGSSTGLREFCNADGAIDVANASRLIRDSEIEACQEAGVQNPIEIRFGYDGIVFANTAGEFDYEFEPEHIYLALAEMVPVDGAMGNNPNNTWSDIDSNWPDTEINIFIPGENHGTREVFDEKVMLVGCEDSGAYQMMLDAGMSEDDAEDACMTQRGDGRSVDIAGNYSETLARVESTPGSFGVFGLFFAQQNPDKVQTATMGGVEPTQESIASGEYPVSRPLQFYVKGEHLGQIPGLEEYVMLFLSDEMVGDFGALVEQGLVPLPQAERDAVTARFQNREGLY
jgi:phosphate transport system substrate-binding protein